jgi:HEAT repeat protein
MINQETTQKENEIYKYLDFIVEQSQKSIFKRDIKANANAMDGLVKIGSFAVETIIKILKENKNIEVQLNLVYVLGKIGNTRSIEILQEISKNENKYDPVAKSARDILNKHKLEELRQQEFAKNKLAKETKRVNSTQNAINQTGKANRPQGDQLVNLVDEEPRLLNALIEQFGKGNEFSAPDASYLLSEGYKKWYSQKASEGNIYLVNPSESATLEILENLLLKNYLINKRIADSEYGNSVWYYTIKG